MSDRQRERAAGAFLLCLLVAPMTIWLAAPPMLHQPLANAECVQVARFAGVVPRTVRAQWQRATVTPHWECLAANGRVLADLGWLVSTSSAEDWNRDR